MNTPRRPFVQLVVRPQEGAREGRRVVLNRYEILVDGKELPGVRAVDVSMAVGGVPQARITLFPSAIELDIDPRLVVERAELTREELLTGIIDLKTLGSGGYPVAARLPRAIERRFVAWIYRPYTALWRLFRVLGMFKPPISEDQARLEVQRRIGEIAAADGTVKSPEHLQEIEAEVLRQWLAGELRAGFGEPS